MIDLPNSQISSLTLLEYDSIDDISLNNILTKFIENDKAITPYSNIFPAIWECSWYNNSNIKGYSKGDAVWYNTENPIDFIQFNSDKIYNYAMANSYLNTFIPKFSMNNLEVYNLYYKIVYGYSDENINLPRLFDLGQLSSPAQVKISKIDNNKEPLSNYLAWDDFFVSDKTSDISSSIDFVLEDVLSSHIKSHHFGIYEDSKSIQNQMLSKYLLKDLTNITPIQKQTNNNWLVDDSGFDYVKNFTNIILEDGQRRWFREWNSGVLEHGGLISISEEDKTNFYKKIDFSWIYNNSSGLETKSPIFSYDYSEDDTFYGDYTKFDNGNIYDKSNNLAISDRYTVSLSPIIHLDNENTTNLSKKLPSSNKNHPLKEIYEMRNDSFKIKIPKNFNNCQYSFYAKGYRTRNG